MTSAPPLGRRLTRHFVLFGAVTGFLLVGLGGWSATAPIASAAVAGGQLSPEGLRMTVQHLEGGIVREILVQEGQEVVSGQPLIIFDSTRAKANLEYDQTQMMRVEAMKARLEAHQAWTPDLVFPQHLIEQGQKDPEFSAFLVAQRNLFIGERLNLSNQLEVFDAQIAQLQAEGDGRREEMAGADEQLVIINAELTRLRTLYEQSLVQRSNVADIERLESELRSRRGLAQALLAQVEQRLAQVRLGIRNAPEEFMRLVADQLSNTNLQLAQIRERVRAGQDVLDRTTVEAPVSGTVVGLRVNTPNAVINPGQPVLDIVPSDATLVVNARLNPIDVDTVHAGLAVEIHVLSFSARSTLPIDGRVTRVSADALVDQATGVPYYSVEIALDESTVPENEREVLISGMPVEVYIFTGSRTFLEYLTAPITASFRRSFRDS